jgi:hypothetical protein
MTPNMPLKFQNDFLREHHDRYQDVDLGAQFSRLDTEMTSALYPDVQEGAPNLQPAFPHFPLLS